MARNWWVAGLPVFSPHTLHQRACSSLRGGHWNGYHSPTLPLMVLVLLIHMHGGFFLMGAPFGGSRSLVHLMQGCTGFTLVFGIHIASREATFCHPCFPCEWAFALCVVCKFMLVLLFDWGLRLCVSFVHDWELDFSPVLGLCNVAIILIVSLGLLSSPGFGFLLGCWGCKHLLWLLLSCFGHARAKNNSEALFDLNCVSPFCLGLSPCYLYLLHGAVNYLSYCGMHWLVFGLLRVGLEARYAWENWCLEPLRQS